jgi:putative peptide zinc metalloprotease protein
MNENRISVTLPSDANWLRFAQDCLHSYCEMVGFSERLEEMCTSSVMEACEELFSKAEKAGIIDPIDLLLDYKGETIVIDIEYNARIPLNPLETGEYEVPDAETGLDNLDMDTLWLHMIKRRMDRVRFKVKGSRHILRMVKYHRDKGKEKQAWVMGIKPQLRKGLLLHLADPDTEHPASTLQAIGVGVLRLSPSETFIIQNMDGKTSFHDLYMAHIDALGLTSPDMLAGLYERLEAMGMLVDPERDAEDTRLRRILKKIISANISIPNADGVVATVHQKTRFMFSYLGLGSLLAIGLSGIIPYWEHHARFIHIITNLEETSLSYPHLILPVYLLTLIHVSLHELGHGVTCKHYGGDVPRLGIMFYLASFIFYCDTTAAWNFPAKRHRILVSLSGPIISFAILGAGLWVAGFYAGTGSIWESVFVAFSLFNLFGLIMNFNPFIKMDAYYMLLDYTDIPNLRERSFKFLERKTLGWIGLGSDEGTKVTLKERKIFWWYGILGGLITILFFAMPLLWLNHLLSAKSISGGKLLFAVLTGALLIVRLGNLAYSKIRAVRHREYKIQ